MGRGPLSSRLRGLGERRELPQWGPGQNPGRKRIWAYFEGSFLYLYDKIWGQFALVSPAPNSGGTCPPVPRDLRPWEHEKVSKTKWDILRIIFSQFCGNKLEIPRYREPFKRDSRVWHRDRQTDILSANAALHYIARPNVDHLKLLAWSYVVCSCQRFQSICRCDHRWVSTSDESCNSRLSPRCHCASTTRHLEEPGQNSPPLKSTAHKDLWGAK